MDGTTLLNLISRWLHIIPVIIMVGGTLFLRLALLPALATSENADLRDAMPSQCEKSGPSGSVSALW